MDIKAKIGELAAKVSGDPAMKEKFEKDPAGTVREMVGNIPPEQQQAIVEGVKTKVRFDNIGSSFGGLFGKK